MSDPRLAQVAADLRDPVRFAQIFLRHQTWSRQEEMLCAVAEHPRVAVKAAHSLSKSFSAAELLLWWLVRWKDGVVLTTSPTARQVESVIWAEVRKTLAARPRIRFPKSNQASLKLADDNFAMGFSTSTENAGVNMAGFKGANLLVIVDEAIGVEGPIWEALDGALATGNTHVVTLCNPLVAGGRVYDSFTRNRAQWRCITIDALDSPNLEGCTLDMLRALPPGLREDGCDPESGRKITDIFDYRPWPQLASRHWVYEMMCKHGERSPWWQARVRGQFPEQSEESLYPLTWLERARGIAYAARLDEPVEVGIDVAGGGSDATVCVIRAGASKIAAHAWSDADPRGEVLAFLQAYRNRIRIVNCDSTGIGHYFARALVDASLPVNFVNFGQASNKRDAKYEIQHSDVKSEIYWHFRDLLERGEVRGLDDEEIAEATTIKFEYTPQGHVKIESKEKRRRRGLASPDRLEALLLAFMSKRQEFAYQTPVTQLNHPYVEEDRQDSWGAQARRGRFNQKGTW